MLKNVHVRILNGRCLTFYMLIRVYKNFIHQKVAIFENLKDICQKVKKHLIKTDICLTTDGASGNNFNNLGIEVLKDTTHQVFNHFHQLFYMKSPLQVRSLNK